MGKRFWVKAAWRAVRFLALLYAGMFLVAWLVADKLVFPVQATTYAETTPGLIRLPLANGRSVPAIEMPVDGARWTFLYFHGNGEDIGNSRAAARQFNARGYSVLLVEYPGYGLARDLGAPSEAGCYEAAEAGWKFLRETRGLPAGNIVICGFSLGTGIAAEMAARHPDAGAAVLCAPFLSTFRVVTRVRLLPWDRFNSIAKIGAVKCPLFVAHGTRDVVVPYWHGERLFAAATAAPVRNFLRQDGINHVFPHDTLWPALAAHLAASERSRLGGESGMGGPPMPL